ncbi:MAG: M48 family metallopeptidase [Candidatus Geothermincolia bacterium]
MIAFFGVLWIAACVAFYTLLNDTPGNRLYMAIAFVIVAFVLFQRVGPWFYTIWKSYKALAGDGKTKYSSELSRWQSAALGVSIAAGVKSPDVVPLSVMSANALTMRRGRSFVIGVSDAALTSDLSDVEIEAIVAHEIARIVTLTYIPPPSLIQYRTLLVALISIAVLAVLAFVFSPIGVALLLILLIPGVFLLRRILGYAELPTEDSPFVLSRSAGPEDDYCLQSEILCDSLAARWISNPEALRDAIERLYALNREIVPAKRELLVANYMFILPGNLPPQKSTYVSSDIPPQKAALISLGLVLQQPDAPSRSKVCLEERLSNLEAILDGSWNSPQRQRSRALRIWVPLVVGIAVLLLILLAALLSYRAVRNIDRPVSMAPCVCQKQDCLDHSECVIRTTPEYSPRQV